MIRSVLTRGALLATGSFQLCGSITRIFFVGNESVQLRQSPILSIDLSRTWYGAHNNSFGRERRGGFLFNILGGGGGLLFAPVCCGKGVGSSVLISYKGT